MARDILAIVEAARADPNPAGRLRGAADVLAHPARCNQRPWDDAVEALLRAEADRHDQETGPFFGRPAHAAPIPGCCGEEIRPDRRDSARCRCFDGPLAIADAILAPRT